jgi:hypothetical protein
VEEFKRIHLNGNTVAEGTIHIANNMRDQSGKGSKIFQSESIVEDESSIFK